jgi:hypothetical protein
MKGCEVGIPSDIREECVHTAAKVHKKAENTKLSTEKLVDVPAHTFFARTIDGSPHPCPSPVRALLFIHICQSNSASPPAPVRGGVGRVAISSPSSIPQSEIRPKFPAEKPSVSCRETDGFSAGNF